MPTSSHLVNRQSLVANILAASISLSPSDKVQITIIVTDLIPDEDQCPISHSWFADKITVISRLTSISSNEIITMVSEFIVVAFCNNCGEPVNAPFEMAYVEEPICLSCRESYYIYNEDEETYVSRHDTEHYENSETQSVYAYDANPLRYLPNCILSTREEKRNLKDQYHPVLLGVEIEVERKPNIDPESTSKLAEYVKTWCILKGDGTLSNGFEIVSAPASFEWHKYGYGAGKKGAVGPWKELLNNPLIRDNFTSWNTGTCGVHVHVSRAAITPLQTGKIMVFLNAVENFEVIAAISGRGDTEYARHQANSNIFEPIRTGRTRSDRYVWFNLTNKATVEFRMFRGNTKYEGFMRYLEFVQATVEFTRDASIRHLHIKNFCKWLKKAENHSRFNILYAFMYRKWSAYFDTIDVRKSMLKKSKPARIDDGYILVVKPYKAKPKPRVSRSARHIIRYWPEQVNLYTVQSKIPL